jgi:hypothetical protein
VPDDDEQGPSIADRVEDVLYTVVGLGVLAVNRAQVARRRLQAEWADTDLGDLAAPFSMVTDVLGDPEKVRSILDAARDELQSIDDRLDGVEHRVSAILDRIEPELPPPLAELTSALRNLANDNADRARSLLGLRLRP